MDDKIATTIFQPLGPIYSIQPWNFPATILIYTNIQSLIAGNTILVKPAPRSPRTVLKIESYFQRAGLLNGEFQALLADHSKTNEIIGHSKVRGVNFTGSTQSGRKIAKICGDHLKKCVLELGGSDPFIVLDDADLQKAVNVGVILRLINCGQNCMSPKRMLIHSSIYEKFKSLVIQKLKEVKTGDPSHPQTTIGLISRPDLLQHLKAQVKETLDAGAKLGFGEFQNLISTEPKQSEISEFLPIILENITPQNPGYHYQFFGPVFCLYSFETDEQALEIANGVDYGLGASIFSENKQRAEKMALEIQAGVININTIQVPNILIPFGGVKGSGIGREGGTEGFHEFTNVKTITAPSDK